LLRVAHLRSFRRAVIAAACDGEPMQARDRAVVVPTHAAADQLVRAIERERLANGGAVVLPALITPRELVSHLGERLPLGGKPPLLEVEREVLMGAACRQITASGAAPPFRLRPALVAEMLEFYDALRRHQKDVAAFERLALARLEPGADTDRGAERLVRQTRFLVAAFTEFERRSAEHGLDEHSLRERLLTETSARPLRHMIVAVGDRAFDRHGLDSADWDLLARVSGLERLDVIATDGAIAGAFHERIHTLLPAIEEVRLEVDDEATPVLLAAEGGALVHTARDREEEVAAFARRAKRAVRGGVAAARRIALVVERPLPYVYIAREICRAAGVPSQMFDAQPLAAEPYAAALDLVCEAVSTNVARPAADAVLRSPHFTFDDADPANPSVDAALAGLARELAPLRTPAPAAVHLTTLADFLTRHVRQPAATDVFGARQLRARGGVLSVITGLRDAAARFDQTPLAFDEVSAIVRRRIETHTFAPRVGVHGVQVVDADSARFGDFDVVQLAGLVDGEWPEPHRRSIFYSPDVLRDLGWPSDADRRSAARARFVDLLRLPSKALVVSTFTLDGDAVVSPSVFVDAIEAEGLSVQDEALDATRIFEHEALGLEEPAAFEALGPFPRAWAAERVNAARRGARVSGRTAPHRMVPYVVSALERYQDCPFLFFSADVLRLEDERGAEGGVTPRERGRLIHAVLRRFFDVWDAGGRRPITPASLDEARALMADVAAPVLAQLDPAEATLERMHVFGSAVAVGAAEAVLALEATRQTPVEERWLERRLEGTFLIGPGGTPVALKGIADRIDLLPNRRLRVVDYKSGAAPDPRRALQVPLYALCAQEELSRRDNRPWMVEEAGYVVLGAARAFVPVVKEGVDGRQALEAARARFALVDGGITRGEFPPRPHDTAICRTCAYAAVCRKDYVRDE
jgi:RecB family exonuclease